MTTPNDFVAETLGKELAEKNARIAALEKQVTDERREMAERDRFLCRLLSAERAAIDVVGARCDSALATLAAIEETGWLAIVELTAERKATARAILNATSLSMRLDIEERRSDAWKRSAKRWRTVVTQQIAPRLSEAIRTGGFVTVSKRMPPKSLAVHALATVQEQKLIIDEQDKEIDAARTETERALVALAVIEPLAWQSTIERDALRGQLVAVMRKWAETLEELADANYWRERWCKENAAATEKLQANWKRGRLATAWKACAKKWRTQACFEHKRANNAELERDALRAALSEALCEFADASQYKGEYLAKKHGDARTIERLRAVERGDLEAAERMRAEDEERARVGLEAMMAHDKG